MHLQVSLEDVWMPPASAAPILIKMVISFYAALSVWNIRKVSCMVLAKLLRDTAVIVWDEAPTASKSLVSAVDLMLQELMHSALPFGGKIILLGGDFRQIPPVLRYVERDAVNHTR